MPLQLAAVAETALAVNPGVNVQLGAITMADIADLRRFAAGGALLICDWPEHVADTLAVLDAAGVRVGLWRFTQDPRQWTGWPGDYQQRCPWALLANEPDLESWPTWYVAGCDSWARAGGLLVEPAYSDEGQRAVAEPRHGEAVAAHVYPLGRGAANLAAVRARAGGRPVLVTEAGIAGAQQDILVRLAAMGVTEPTWLYSYRARDVQAVPAYDLASISLIQPTQTKGASMELAGVMYTDLRDTIAANRSMQAQWPLLADVKFIGVHHSGAENTYEADFDYQVRDEGWWHGGYHFGIEVDGAIKYGLDMQYQAYQLGAMPFENPALFPYGDAQWYNEHGLAVVVSGDLTKHPPSDAQLRSLEAVLAAMERQVGIGPYQFTGLTPGTAFGHGELPGKLSDCPGQLLAWVRQRRLRALNAPMPAPAPPITDPIEAEAAGRFAALGIAPQRQGAIFRAYVQRTKAWLDGGKSNTLDPTPAIRPEVNTGGDAYAAFDNGEIYHWRAGDGLVYLVEASERDAIWKACGW